MKNVNWNKFGQVVAIAIIVLCLLIFAAIAGSVIGKVIGDHYQLPTPMPMPTDESITSEPWEGEWQYDIQFGHVSHYKGTAVFDGNVFQDKENPDNFHLWCEQDQNADLACYGTVVITFGVEENELTFPTMAGFLEGSVTR